MSSLAQDSSCSRSRFSPRSSFAPISRCSSSASFAERLRSYHQCPTTRPTADQVPSEGEAVDPVLAVHGIEVAGAQAEAGVDDCGTDSEDGEGQRSTRAAVHACRGTVCPVDFVLRCSAHLSLSRQRRRCPPDQARGHGESGKDAHEQRQNFDTGDGVGESIGGRFHGGVEQRQQHDLTKIIAIKAQRCDERPEIQRHEVLRQQDEKREDAL
nr:hypothetical protein CFP56_20545 [Quercus suber]